MNKNWTEAINGIRTGISLYFVATLVTGIMGVVKLMNYPLDVESIMEFSVSYTPTGADVAIGLATILAIVGLFVIRASLKKFSEAQSRKEDADSVLDIYNGYSWLISATILSAVSFFVPLLMAIIVLIIFIVAITGIRRALYELSGSPVVTPTLSESYAKIRTCHGWILASIFLGPIGAIINFIVFFVQYSAWEEIENNPLGSGGLNQYKESIGLKGDMSSYDVERLKSIVADSPLYNPNLVEACKRELELRERSSAFKDIVQTYDDMRLNEILTTPEVYSEELVYCCRVEQAAREKKWQEELDQQAMREAIRAQILREIEAEQRAAQEAAQLRVDSPRKELPRWIWWPIGGVGVAVIVLVCVLVFRPSKNSYTPVYDLGDTYEQPSYDSSHSSYDIPGKYPYASTRLLTESDLYGLSKWELKIMRNEILARYGYIFKTEALREYFSQQYWYEGRYTDVGSMITSLEWKNIKLIKQFEKM